MHNFTILELPSLMSPLRIFVNDLLILISLIILIWDFSTSTDALGQVHDLKYFGRTATPGDCAHIRAFERVNPPSNTVIVMTTTVQVPSRNLLSPEESLKEFSEKDIPALGLLGTTRYIPPECPYVVDCDVQLVCKYLNAFHTKTIDRLYKEGAQ